MNIDPCPFCNTTRDIRICRATSEVLYRYQVQCDGCSARGPFKNDEETAILAWNCTPPAARSLQELKTQLKALRDLADSTLGELGGLVGGLGVGSDSELQEFVKGIAEVLVGQPGKREAYAELSNIIENAKARSRKEAFKK